MTIMNGQTGQVLKVQIKSVLLGARWGLAEVSSGGTIPLEVTTAFVSDGSDITLTVKDLEGNTLETFKGKVYGNLFRTLYAASKPNRTGAMFFEAELPAHGLKGVSGRMKVWPPVKVEKLRWMTEDGSKKAEKVARGTTVMLKANLTDGPVSGNVCVEIFCEADGKARALVRRLHDRYADKKLEFLWSTDVKSPSPKLEAKLTFVITLLGSVSAPSEALEYLDVPEFKFSR